MSDAPWLAIAQGEVGVKETPGPEHNPRIVEYFRESGHSGIKDDETPWCSAFMNWVFAKAGIVGTGSLAARSWLKWGKPLSKPKPGAVVVFWRGNPRGWQGHVGLYLGEYAGYISVLGGNQGDSVKISKYPRSNLLGYRWPTTMGNSRTVKAQTVVGVATAGVAGAEMAESNPPADSGLAAVQDSIGEALPVLQGMSIYMPWVKYVLMGVVLVSVGLTIYFRWLDKKEKGR